MVLFVLTFKHEHGTEAHLFLSAGKPECFEIATKLGLDHKLGDELSVVVVNNVRVDHQDHVLLAQLGIPTL